MNVADSYFVEDLQGQLGSSAASACEEEQLDSFPQHDDEEVVERTDVDE
jgi:hypothetical protein